MISRQSIADVIAIIVVSFIISYHIFLHRVLCSPPSLLQHRENENHCVQNIRGWARRFHHREFSRKKIDFQRLNWIYIFRCLTTSQHETPPVSVLSRWHHLFNSTTHIHRKSVDIKRQSINTKNTQPSPRLPD